MVMQQHDVTLVSQVGEETLTARGFVVARVQRVHRLTLSRIERGDFNGPWRDQ